MHDCTLLLVSTFSILCDMSNQTLLKMPGIPTELLKGYPDMGILLTIGAFPSSGKILPIHL
jgi:hypothetical protein